MFEKSRWIWQNAEHKPDEYADFKIDLVKISGKKYIMSLSADSNYFVAINGKTAFFGQYSDYPEYKAYDSVDITDYLSEGNNEIIVSVYYHGIELPTYALGEAGFIYEITEDGQVIAVSNENTLSRLSPYYQSHKCTELSFFLGFTFTYDLTAAETPFDKSIIIPKQVVEFIPRPIERLVMRDRAQANIIKYGSFIFGDGEDLGKKMHSAKLSNAEFKDNVITGENGVYLISELKMGDAGFLDFDIELPSEADIYIGYGEHLWDGLCRTNNFNYTCVIKGKKGRNVFTEKFRRFGCRYIQVFLPVSSAKINYLGLRPTDYPIEYKPFSCDNERRNRIYEVAVNTMRCCMHEHYEDCPSREQALYTFDSRNEMLFTYQSTGDYKFARGCLALINRGINEKAGLLNLTYPSHAKICIPSYTPSFFLQVKEYIEHSGDKSIAFECFETLEKLEKRFSEKMDSRGVISNFSDEDVAKEVRLWDFYEWSGSMKDDPHCADFDAPLNAWYSIALDSFAYICDVLGKDKKAAEMRNKRDALNKNIVKVFFEPDKKVFKSFENKWQGKYSVYTQSLCVFCGAADYVDSSFIFEILENNGSDKLDIDSDTLSTCCIRYDVLLKKDSEKYGKVVLEDIDSVYGYMTDLGSTTLWEYKAKLEDYDSVDKNGSLCHAWSCVPLLYYRTLILGEEYGG